MKKRLLSILTALALCLSLLTVTALAASDPGKLVFDISEGSVIIEEGTEAGTIKVTYGNGQVKDGISHGETIIVTGSFTKTEGDEAAHQLAVSTSANIIARDLTIDNTGFDGCCVMAVAGEAANVTLSLEGENTFTAGMGSPCITVANDSTLTIEGDGSVTAQGGGLHGCAGISACYGNIIISGGTVNAIGGETELAGVSTHAIAVTYGDITVSGGTLNAIGGNVKDISGESTGIFAREADIIISGGTVNASGEDVAADENRSIGISAESGSIIISGGEVNATGGKATGNHCWSRGIHVSNGDLTMSDGEVNATGGKATGEKSQSSGIYAGGDIVINGGTVEAAGGAATGKDGISSGIYAYGDITVSGTADVAARGSDIILNDDIGDEATAMARESYGILTQDGDIIIHGGTLEAVGGNNAAWSMGIHSRGEGKVTVNGGTLNTTGGHTKCMTSQSCAVSYGISGNGLTVNGGTVTVTSGDVYGNSPESFGITVGQVTIAGGTVNAASGTATAKWGGTSSGAISSWGNIEISGGTVTAEGGNATFGTETEHDPDDCASSLGIRSGHGIEISGGTVEAAGGTADTESFGIKVQYHYYPDYGESDGGYFTVSGGEVNATGGAADANSYGIYAIIYRYDASISPVVESGSIAITGGHMTARTPAGGSAAARMALNVAPILPDAYWWRTAETDAFTASATPYTFGYAHTYVQFVTGISFVDVTANDYYFDAVQWAVNNGITNGTSDTTFSPDAPCTRAQAVAFLWRAAGCLSPKSSATPFKDVVKGSYYETAVLWAVENGITNGTSATTFSPEDICSRAQIATFLWRSQGMPDAGKTNPFTDVPSGEYYYNAVLWAVVNGITKGTSATTFSPNDDCTRAQIVTFLYRCLRK